MLALVNAMSGNVASRTTWPFGLLMVPAKPISVLPDGQGAVATFESELAGLVTATRWSPATGFAQIACAVMLQVPAAPVSSSTP